jgi:hypothetical protein
MATLQHPLTVSADIEDPEDMSIISPEDLFTHADIEAQIARYEDMFGISSTEFLRRMQNGDAEDSFEAMHWMMLLRHR